MNTPIRILYYDDHPLDRGLVRTALEKEGDRFQVVEVSSRAGLVEGLALNHFDLLLADDVAQDLGGLEALNLAWARHPGLPVVFLSSGGQLEFAVEAIKRGAADYLVKSREAIQKLPQTLQEVLVRPRREKEQQRDALHRQLQELTVLHAASTAASAALSEEALVQTITQIISDTFQITHLSIGFIDEAAGQLRPYRSFVLPDGNGDFALALGDGVSGWVALHGSPRNVPDVRLEPDYRMVNPDTHSELCVPIKTGNRVLGVINVESDDVNAFTEADERLLATLSGQLATAIERIRLFEQTQRQAREISGLYDIALTTSSVLEADALLDRIYLQVQQLIKPDTFMIVLSGEQPASYYVALAMEEGQAVDEWVGMPISVDEGLTGWIIRTRQTLLIRDMIKDYLPAQPKHSSRPARSWLGTPVIARDRLIGVISVQSFQPDVFDHTHRRFYLPPPTQPGGGESL